MPIGFCSGEHENIGLAERGLEISPISLAFVISALVFTACPPKRNNLGRLGVPDFRTPNCLTLGKRFVDLHRPTGKLNTKGFVLGTSRRPSYIG